MTDEEYYKAANSAISSRDPAKFIEIVNKMDNVNFVGCIEPYPNGPIMHALPLLHAATILLSNPLILQSSEILAKTFVFPVIQRI